MVAHICLPSTQQAGAGQSCVQSFLELCSEVCSQKNLRASQGRAQRTLHSICQALGLIPQHFKKKKEKKKSVN
jgi:hypothetical protein